MANTKPKVKTDYIHIRVSPKVKAAAQTIAAHEDRSLSDLIAESLKHYIRSRYPAGAS